tara:strand:+ start:2002 stop:3681 length:1680 start_codon:yes stop_codon:yes gene_type:complete
MEGLGAIVHSGEPAPEAWHGWVGTLFPSYVEHAMGERHIELWEHVWSIDYSSAPRSFCAFWPRAGGKTTTAEMACTALGVRDARKYAWYVSETQDKADKNVENIAAQLESTPIEKYYPQHASRKVSKYGTSRGWRRNRLRTAGNFTIDAVGLDTAARGLKVEEQRPDLIILDDIDGKHDTLATTAKKIATLTTSVLPAGSSNVAVIFVQNLIIKDGVASRLADGRADFLADRIISGPHPAVTGLKYEWVEVAGEVRRAHITAGEPTWSGQSLEVCQRMIERMGLIAFLKECQHKVKELAEGVVLSKYDPSSNSQEWSDDDLRLAFADGRLVPFAGIDYGLWRFAFLLLATDRAGRVHVIDEYFSQRETLSVRARHIHGVLSRYGIIKLKVYGDPANPTDSLEMNTSLEEGWVEDDEHVRPKWRAHAAVKERGSRLTGPDRINEMYEQRSLLVRRGIGKGGRWHLGMNANSPGDAQIGSRFLWEQENWSFPNPLEGRSQDQNPDDHTADGADMMAAYRYAIMSHLSPAEYELPEEEKVRNFDHGLEEMVKKVVRQHELMR